jgi:hypothetical protein
MGASGRGEFRTPGATLSGNEPWASPVPLNDTVFVPAPIQAGRRPSRNLEVVMDGLQQQASEIYGSLAARLGFDPVAVGVEGPVRGPMMGPSDEAPIDAVLRLSMHLESIAAEIRALGQTDFQDQLWQHWAILWYHRME